MSHLCPAFFTGTLVCQSRDLLPFYVVARDVNKTKNTCKFISLCFALFSKVRYDILLSIFNAYTVEN